jgi:membrane fusion protein, multidrug efflux system
MKKTTWGGKPQAKKEDTYDSQDLADKKDGKGAAAAKKKRRTPVLIGGIVLIVLVVTGLSVGGYLLIDSINFVSTDDASIAGDHVNLSAKMLGRIKTFSVDEGDLVAPGQALVLLDDADLRAQLSSAQATRDGKEQDLTRTRALYAGCAATKQQLDAASTAYDYAAAQLAVIESQLANTKITAPIPGTIAKKNYSIGDIVQPGQTIFTINNLANIWVTANFEETQIHRIQPGAAVAVTVDAFPGREFKGKVAQISAGIVPPAFSIGEFTKTTQRVPVKILLDAIPEGVRLLPGLSVEVKISAH